MMTAKEIVEKYISFFEKRGHNKIANSQLIPQNDPTTLFINSGMQPLVPYLLGETHPEGKRLVNVQNCFRAQDIEEIGNNRHTTFFRMLGNWSLGDYFKKEQLPWIFEFLTSELGLDPRKLYVTVFAGDEHIPKDTESIEIWKDLFSKVGIEALEGERILNYGFDKNWWSRAGTPDKMPPGEPGGPSSEVFYDFQTKHDPLFGEQCHVNCDCGRYVEIGNSVFMQYKKETDGTLSKLSKPNVDFGGGLERLLAAIEHKPDVFQTSLFTSILQSIEVITKKTYVDYSKQMRIIADHLTGAVFMASNGVIPSNKEQGYIMRRLIRRGLDNIHELEGTEIEPIIATIVQQYKDTDPELEKQFETVKNTVLEENQKYAQTQKEAKKYIHKKYPSANFHSDESSVHPERIHREREQAGQAKIGDELKGTTEITAEDAFILYSTHGLSPTQIKSLGFTFDEQAYAQKMEEHQVLSRSGAGQKFRGGLSDHQEKTIMGHTATHLLHQALRDMFGKQLHQTGSNITTERLRFDFNYDNKLTDEEIKQLEKTVNEKIKENIPVHFEMMAKEEADKLGAIGLFADTYGDKVKIYFIGGPSARSGRPYSVEFCGGPHVDFTGKLKKFTIIKQENIGHGQRRIYAKVGE